MDFGTALSTNLASSSADFTYRKRDKAIAEESEELKIKPWFHNHLQHCDNVAHTQTNHHDNTIIRNNELADNVWKIREYFHFLLFLRRDWEAISKTRASGFIRVSKHEKTDIVFEFSRVWKPWLNPMDEFLK